MPIAKKNKGLKRQSEGPREYSIRNTIIEGAIAQAICSIKDSLDALNSCLAGEDKTILTPLQNLISVYNIVVAESASLLDVMSDRELSGYVKKHQAARRCFSSLLTTIVNECDITNETDFNSELCSKFMAELLAFLSVISPVMNCHTKKARRDTLTTHYLNGDLVVDK